MLWIADLMVGGSSPIADNLALLGPWAWPLTHIKYTATGHDSPRPSSTPVSSLEKLMGCCIKGIECKTCAPEKVKQFKKKRHKNDK